VKCLRRIFNVFIFLKSIKALEFGKAFILYRGECAPKSPSVAARGIGYKKKILHTPVHSHHLL